jgi:hypothetical protein
VIAVAGHVHHVFQKRVHVVLSNVINRPAGPNPTVVMFAGVWHVTKSKQNSI